MSARISLLSARSHANKPIMSVAKATVVIQSMLPVYVRMTSAQGQNAGRFATISPVAQPVGSLRMAASRVGGT